MRAVTAQDVLGFWFGSDRKAWFEKNPAFDDEIRRRFLSLYEHGAAGMLSDWRQTPARCLALVILLDQFPRNKFPGSVRALSAHALALETAQPAPELRLDPG